MNTLARDKFYHTLVQADFAETTPIPVHLEVSESDSVPPLPADSTTDNLGGPLTPVLQRYTAGDRQAVTSISQDVRLLFLLTDHFCYQKDLPGCRCAICFVWLPHC